MIRERRGVALPGRPRWRQPERTVEVTVGELGPSLRWATATTTGTTRNQGQ
jgi:hypothetical protein